MAHFVNGLLIEEEGNPIISNPSQMDIIGSADFSIGFSRKEKSLINITTQLLGGGGTGGGGIGKYYGSGAPGTLHNNGDHYFDTSTSPYTWYIQRSGVWVLVYSAIGDWYIGSTGLNSAWIMTPPVVTSAGTFIIRMSGNDVISYQLVAGTWTSLGTIVTTVDTPVVYLISNGTELFAVIKDTYDLFGTYLYRSTDGTNWTNITLTMPDSVKGIDYDGTYFYTMSGSDSNTKFNIYRSADAISWSLIYTSGVLAHNTINKKIKCVNSKIYVFDTAWGEAYVSSNIGASFSDCTGLPGVQLQDIFGDGTYFYAPSWAGEGLYRSSNGIAFSQVSLSGNSMTGGAYASSVGILCSYQNDGSSDWFIGLSTDNGGTFADYSTGLPSTEYGQNVSIMSGSLYTGTPIFIGYRYSFSAVFYFHNS